MPNVIKRPYGVGLTTQYKHVTVRTIKMTKETAANIGMVTPPLRVNLFVAAGLQQTKTETAINKYLAMYIISGQIILLLITYVPDIVMFLPNLMIPNLMKK